MTRTETGSFFFFCLRAGVQTSWPFQYNYVHNYILLVPQYLFFILLNVEFLLPRPTVHMSGYTSAALW